MEPNMLYIWKAKLSLGTYVVVTLLQIVFVSSVQGNETNSIDHRLRNQRDILAFASLLKYGVDINGSDNIHLALYNILKLLNKDEKVKEKVALNLCENWSFVNEDLDGSNPNRSHIEMKNSTDFCTSILENRCLSIDQLVSLLKNNSDLPSAVGQLCPVLLFQSHDPGCANIETPAPLRVPESLKSTETSAEVPKTRSKPSPTAVWGFGFLFVTVVSCCSLVGVALLPLLSKNIYQTVLVLFEGLAVGSLASSALFHLIPQAFGLLGQDLEHKYLWRSLIIFGGIYLFFLSERGMKIIIQKKQHKKLKRVNADVVSLTLSPSDLSANSHVLGNGKPALSIHDMVNKENGNITTDTEACAPAPQGHHGHVHGGVVAFNGAQPQKDGTKQAIATVAWMIIFGDGLHNFIDGLSMGAAFSDSILSGVSISVAVICEEFPHELGDFAVLLSAGMTLKQALMYNFLSACTCYLGLIFGIILGDIAEGGPYIFALAGGMFLYISLVDMVGELSEAMEEASQKGTREMVKVFALQNLGILIGVATLFLMARYSEKINFDSLSHLGGAFQPDEVQFFSNNAEPILGTFGDA